MDRRMAERMIQIMTRSIALIIMMVLISGGAYAANTSTQVDFLLSGSLKADGSLNAGGKVYTCDAGTVCGPSTSDPKTTWQDSAKAVAHADPIVLDSNGKATVFADGIYKFQIYDSDDTLIETLDNIDYVYSGATGRTVSTIDTSNNVVGASDDTVECDATSGNVTTNMSNVSAVGNSGKRITFKKTDSTTNTCTIDPVTTQTIDGATTAVLSVQYDDITIESDGTNWNEVRGMVWSRAATFHNTSTFYNASTFYNTATFYNAATFSNITLSSTGVTTIKDEDDMESDLVTALATQQSIRAYVDSIGVSNVISYRTNGLEIFNATDVTVDIDADFVLVGKSTGHLRSLTSVDLTVDLTASGANGLDNGTAAGSTWYYMWVIAKEDDTTAGLLSTGSAISNITLPGDYVYAYMVGAIYNTASSGFPSITQEGEFVDYNSSQLMNSTTLSVSAWTAFDITAFYPPTAKRIYVWITGMCDGCGISPRSDGWGGDYMVGLLAGGDGDSFNILPKPYAHQAVLSIRYEPTIYYYAENLDTGLYARGWKY